jgi:Fic family protein
MTKQELFKKADDYKSLIHSNKPLSSEQLKELDNYFRIGFTFRSNSMEGSTLTITETKMLLEEGTTVSGNSMENYYEVTGQAEAYDYMLSLARMEQLEITETIIKKLHFLCYNRIDQEEAGQYRKIQAQIPGTDFLFPKPEDVPHLMEHLINQIESSKRLMHPIEFAALCHKRLFDIQPFKDGNGSIARLLMNLILVNSGYGIISISPELRDEYRNALLLAQKGNNTNIDSFIELIAKCVIESERDYCRLLKINIC